MAFIKVIEHTEAEGRLKEIYDHLVDTRGKLAEVHKIQSLNPESIVNHMDLYLTLMFGKSPLKRYQREMIAVVVSATNNCEYCQVHHALALNHYWKDEQKVRQLRKDYKQLTLSELDQLLCDYARELTLNEKPIKQSDFADKLRAKGADDKLILDANLIIAYFNFVNRMIIGLGVHLEDDGGGGYNY